MPGFDILDATLLPALMIAVIAGLFSFASPCVLPIVPPYLAYMSGMTLAEMATHTPARNRALVRSALFVLGLSVVFVILGLTAAALGNAFIRNQVLFQQIAGVVIILFGLHFLRILTIPVLSREFRLDTARISQSPVGAFVLGLAFAFGWTPCIGPQLGAILALAAQEDSVARGGLLLLFYAAGLGIPFIIVALLLARMTRLIDQLKSHMRTIEIAMGVLLIAIGLLLVTGRFSLLSYWLIETFPFLALVG